jgi:ABC-type Fe3+ transport system permease subunit
MAEPPLPVRARLRSASAALARAAGTAALVVLTLLVVAVPLARTILLAGQATSTGIAPLLRSAGGSLLLAVLVCLLGSLLALGAALATRTAPRAARPVLVALACAPAALPPGAVAASVLDAAGPSGWIPVGGAAGVHGLLGMTWAMTVAFAPTAYLLDLLVLTRLDSRVLEAAACAGAGTRRLLGGIVVPHLRPALVVGAVLLVVAAVSDPSVPAVLRGRMPNLAHLGLDTAGGWGQDALAARSALLLAVPGLATALLLPGLGPSIRRTGVPGSAPALPGSVGRSLLRVAAAPALVLLGLNALCLSTVLLGATHALLGEGGEAAIASGGSVVATTLLHAGAACLLGLPLAWFGCFGRGGPPRWSGRMARAIMSLLLVLPGTTVGIAFSLAYRVPPHLGAFRLPPLVGGSAAAGGSVTIVLMYMTVALPLLHLGIDLLARSVSHDTVDVLRSSGVPTMRVVRHGVLPRLAPLIAGLAAAVVAHCLVAVVPLVYTTAPESPLVATRTLDLADHFLRDQVFLLAALTGVVAALLLAAVAAALRALTASGREKG